MASLPMMWLIEKVARGAGPKTIWLTRPAELDLALTDQAKFVICNHTIEQDHRGVKRVTRPMLGFKAFGAAQGTLLGIELMHMIRKKQMVLEVGEEGLTAVEQFYSLAA
jgi:putative transposase